MNRGIAILILLVAVLVIVLLSFGTDKPDATPAAESDLSAATRRDSPASAKHGIAWANWRDRTEPEVRPSEKPALPELSPDSGIPADVRERLARDFKGMDVYVLKGSGDE